MYGPAWPFKKRNENAHSSGDRQRREKFTRLFAERFLAIDSTGVLIMDAEFRIVEINQTISGDFGLESADFSGCPVEQWFEAIGCPDNPFDRSLLQGRIFRNRSWVWGEGTKRRSLMLDGDVLQDWENGEITGAFVLFRDVSHLVQLEEQIRQSDRLKTIGQIAAGTAHEIRNPLTAIRGFMQLLGKSVADRELVKEQEFVSIMMSELDRVNQLVNEFLLLSKPKEVKLVCLRAGIVLEEILPVIRNEALLHGVIVLYEPKPECSPVWVDKEQLKQVFLNLAKNAIEAMNEGGTLMISERKNPERPGTVSVVMRDTGPGIPAEMLDKIFDPFFTTKPQGTGLGLSICQRIVHDLGGQLEVVSDGSGTSFTLWLPTGAS